MRFCEYHFMNGNSENVFNRKVLLLPKSRLCMNSLMSGTDNDDKNISSTWELNMSELTQLIKDESGERKKIKTFFEEIYNNIFMEKDTFVNNRTLHKIPTTLLWLPLLQDENILSMAPT